MYIQVQKIMNRPIVSPSHVLAPPPRDYPYLCQHVYDLLHQFKFNPMESGAWITLYQRDEISDLEIMVILTKNHEDVYNIISSSEVILFSMTFIGTDIYGDLHPVNRAYEMILEEIENFG